MKRHLVRAALGLCLAFAVLLALELGLRPFGYPSTEPLAHVRVRLDMGGPVFLIRGGQVVCEFQDREQVRSFEPRPGPGVRRVFFFGASSVRGGSRLPAQEEAPALLEEQLRDRGLEAEVINLGRGGLDSEQVLEILEQSLTYQPELLVIYLGHNDLGNVVFQNRYGTVGASLGLRVRLLLGRTALYQFLHDQLIPKPDVPLAPPGSEHGDDPLVAVLLQEHHEGQSDLVTPDDPRRAMAARDLQASLEQMVDLGLEAGVEVVVVTPISDLRHAPHGGGEATDWHQRGLARLGSGDQGGYQDLIRARDTDAVPLRATSPMVEVVRRTAVARGARLVDLEAQATERHGAPPSSWFIDPVHFSADGHRVLASELAPVVAELLEARGQAAP